ncbi:hypothetical protein [Sphingomonas sp. VNH70]|uniref:hypothetical protein n=1 Tax=Sphingomonas silueang TaxID=3156617 RepID=UPI0032B31324
MPSWREVAASLLEPQGAGPVPASPPRQPRRYSDLPSDIAEGLESLRRVPTGRFRGDTTAWARVVDDAHTLALDGWAGKALALGWSAHDVFGIGRRDSLDFAGLAVWLDGREVVVMNADRAMVRDRSGMACFERGGWGHGRDACADPGLLWQFGR